MAIVVRHRETGQEFVLVGSGLGLSATSRPSMIFGTLLPSEEQQTTLAAAVCDGQGAISWVYTRELIVVSVDGVPPHELLIG